MGGIADKRTVAKAVITGIISYAILAMLTGPLFAAVLMVALLIHEFGHLWAMKRCGMRIKGLYFIPLVGAAAVPDGDFPSRKTEAFTAIMGPAWGFGSALLVYGLYLICGLPQLALVAKWIAILNAFNLIPVSPLDGGRVVKSVIASVSPKAGLVFLALGPLIAIGATLYTGIWIFALVALFSYQEYKRHLYDTYARRDAKTLAQGFKEELGEMTLGAASASDRELLITERFYERVRDGRFYRMALKAENLLEADTERKTPILNRPLVATPEIIIWKPEYFLDYLLRIAIVGDVPDMTNRQACVYAACYLALGAVLGAVWMLGAVGAEGLTFLDLLSL